MRKKLAIAAAGIIVGVFFTYAVIFPVECMLSTSCVWEKK